MTVADVPPIRFAEARDGARLAYQDFGEGPHVVVAIPPFAQNIEMAWEQPVVRRMFERFASFCRFIHYDKRGTGASDRRSRVPGLDERVEDVRAVMDAADVDSAHLYVQSEGGPMSILLAATYPDRVRSLVMFGTGPFTFPRDMSEADMEAYRVRAADFVATWGTPASTLVERFAPSLAGDAGFVEWHQRYERSAADSDSLAEMIEISRHADVTELLARISVPTLVMHRTDDVAIPVEWGRLLADGIPGAEWREYEGTDHYSYAGDISWMDDVERWVTGSVAPVRDRRPRPSVVVRTLGRFAVEVDGHEVQTSEWGSRLARQILKRLVAARGWPVTRDQLMDMLWPDEHDIGRLSARLSVQLSTVRRILGGGVIADREVVRLDLEEVDTDLEVFFAAAADEDVVAACPGEFLPEDVYEDWSSDMRAEVRSRFVAAARRLADAALDAGDHGEAARLARRLIAEDRYDEAAHRLLVATLTGWERHGEAREAHEAWVQAMGDIGVEVPPPA